MPIEKEVSRKDSTLSARKAFKKITNDSLTKINNFSTNILKLMAGKILFATDNLNGQMVDLIRAGTKPERMKYRFLNIGLILFLLHYVFKLIIKKLLFEQNK